MAGLSYPSEEQSQIESTNAMDWTQNSVTPHDQMGTSSQSQVSLNNWTQCPTQDDAFSTQQIVLESSSMVPTTVLEAVIDERHIEECLNRPLSLPYQLRHHARNEKHQGGSSKISSNYTSAYRGVTKCNEQRYEAFVRDNTIQGESGRTAARAHDLISIKIGGTSAPTNFPVSCYWKEIGEMKTMNLRDFIDAVRRKGKGFTDKDCAYRGVYKNPGSRTWQARLGQHDRGMLSIYLGTYYTAEDAARSYDIASIKMKGKAAITNFDLNSYDVKGIMDGVNAFAMSSWKIQTHNHNGVVFQSSTETHGHKPNPCKGKKPKNNSSQRDQQEHNFHGFQQPNPIPNNPYILDNSSGNYEGTLQQSLLIGTGQDFQASQLQNLVNVNNNDPQPHNLVNNQVLEQSPSIPILQGSLQTFEIQNYLSFPNGPSGFGTQTLGETMEYLSNTHSSNQVVNGSLGASNGGACSFGLQSTVIHPIEPSNQGFETTQLHLPALDQSFECYNNYPPRDNLNQNPSQNLNASLSYGFQNPSSGENDDFQSHMIGEIQEDFDISQYLNSSYMEQNDCTNI
ncbi:DNA-binding domain superfamily [Sesbania bispinosa]|nr:DNA-binding domain superfamily [Sesbania bispinosa]